MTYGLHKLDTSQPNHDASCKAAHDERRTAPARFWVKAAQAKASSTFVLTIEPVFNDPAAPADTHILAGPMRNGAARLTTNHPAALGTDFRRSYGGFILATPSNSNATPTKGIWYLDKRGKRPTASLKLPKLPAGWRYEGWIAGPKGPVSTGSFTNAAAEDSDGPGRTAGPKRNTPKFPGQDFIVPPVDLVGMKAVISVEPSPDNSKAPFSMKPLLTTIKPSNNRLQNISAKNLPSARVTVKF